MCAGKRGYPFRTAQLRLGLKLALLDVILFVAHTRGSADECSGKNCNGFRFHFSLPPIYL